jgi:hypothetical protein
MKKRILIIISLFVINIINAQSNSYPITGNIKTFDYSPLLILQRNTASGGFIQGVQTKFQDGTDNWFFGNLHAGSWIVSKGDYQNPKMTVLDNGNVGIGTTTPTQKLDLNGNINMAGVAGRRLFMGGAGGSTFGIAYDSNYPNYGIFYTESEPDYVSISPNGNATDGVMNIIGNGNVGIGTKNPSNDQGWNRVLDVAGSGHSKILVTADNSTFKTGIFTHTSWHGGGGFIGTESNNTLFLIAGYDPKVTILTNGNVGVGTKSPDQKLTVKGKIHAEEVKIDLSIPVPDYVFASDYKLKTLKEVEDYVNKNNHLPEIPSAKEIEINGLMLAEMNMSLLKKVEELTLYSIDQKKTIEKQAIAIQKLEKENESFKSLSERLTTIEKELKTKK